MKFKLPKISPKQILSINFIAFLIILNVILAFLTLPRLDLTKNKLHTISPSLKQIVEELDDVINITVYQTDNLPAQVKPSIDSLKNTLNSLKRQNPTRLIVTYINPKDNGAQDAINQGIQPIQFSTMEQDSFQVQNAFFGLTVSYQDNVEVMPVISDIGNLEYFLASSINKITKLDTPALAIATGHGQIDPSTINTIGRFLSQSYQISQVDTDSEDWQIPPKSILILLSPQVDFSAPDIQKLEDHIKDNAVLVLFDKFQVDQSLTATSVNLPNFEAFLQNHGFTIKNSLILDQSSTITSFSSQSSQFLVQYPYWIKILPENLNPDSPATSDLSSLILNWASPIELSQDAFYLAKSSLNSSTSLATNLSPTIKSDIDKNNTSQSVVAALNTQMGKIGLISDADFIKDDFLNSQDNLIFFLNLIDYLNSDELLLSIRSKAVSIFPLKTTDNQTRNIIRISNIGLIPVILLSLFLVNKKIQKISHKKFRHEIK